MIEIASEHVTEVFTGFGELGVRAEAVARSAVDEARAYLAANVPVGQHLADQLLVPLALSAVEGSAVEGSAVEGSAVEGGAVEGSAVEGSAVEGGGGKFRTYAPTRHTATNIEVIGQFLDVRIAQNEITHGIWDVEVEKV